MKKLVLALISIVVLSSCKEEIKINQDFYGHWMQKDFYDQVISKKNIQDISAPLAEFIISANDTNYSLITLGKKTKTGPFELINNDQLMLKNFFGSNHNADVKLNKEFLEIINPYTEEKVIFIKLSDSLVDSRTKEMNSSYSIPFLNKMYISGNYADDTANVSFTDNGEILGLGKFKNYSFCFTPDCRTSNSNSIFLSDERYEGNFYDYEFNGDSLIIFEIDTYAIARGMNSERKGIKFAFKKIN